MIARSCGWRTTLATHVGFLRGAVNDGLAAVASGQQAISPTVCLFTAQTTQHPISCRQQIRRRPPRWAIDYVRYLGCYGHFPQAEIGRIALEDTLRARWPWPLDVPLVDIFSIR